MTPTDNIMEEPTQETVRAAMDSYFRTELLNLILLCLLAAVAITILVLLWRWKEPEFRKHRHLTVGAVAICVIGLFLLVVARFVPVCKDYKEGACVTVSDAEIFIKEGSRRGGPLTRGNEVTVHTADGATLTLTITQDYRFETDVTFVGTVVYTERTKHIVWYATDEP